MITFLFIACLIMAALMTRVHLFFCIPFLIAAYLIASKTDFRHSGDRSFWALLIGFVVAWSVTSIILSWIK